MSENIKTTNTYNVLPILVPACVPVHYKYDSGFKYADVGATGTVAFAQFVFDFKSPRRTSLIPSVA